MKGGGEDREETDVGARCNDRNVFFFKSQAGMREKRRCEKATRQQL